MTEQEFAESVEWEGGPLMALDYGLKAKNLNNPNSEFAVAWKELEDAYAALQPLLYRVGTLIESILDGVEQEE